MAAYQVRREQLTDQQWSDLCKVFEFLEHLKVKILAKRAKEAANAGCH